MEIKEMRMGKISFRTCTLLNFGLWLFVNYSFLSQSTSVELKSRSSTSLTNSQIPQSFTSLYLSLMEPTWFQFFHSTVDQCCNCSLMIFPSTFHLNSLSSTGISSIREHLSRPNIIIGMLSIKPWKATKVEQCQQFLTTSWIIRTTTYLLSCFLRTFQPYLKKELSYQNCFLVMCFTINSIWMSGQQLIPMTKQ